jgi:DUF4097 and DUF4098 domain-containing protein YvlB
MKLRLPALVAATLVAAVFARADDYSFKEPFKQTGAFSPTGSLALENVNGDVEIRTWDRNEILIEGEKSAKTEEELKAIDLKMDISEGRAAIKARFPKRSGNWFAGNTIRASVRFRIVVPATASIERIATVNASVSVDGARGGTHVETVNGTIQASDLGGSARCKTVNGQIDASFTSVVAGQELSLETVNGSVTVGLPKDAGVVLATSVVNGRVSCDFPLTLGKSSGKQNLRGTIGDGRASLKAGTVNGNIHIEQR